MTITNDIDILASLGFYIDDSAFKSWLTSTRRLLKTIRCPICHRPARVRRGFILCGACGKGWELDYIQDLISEIEAVREPTLSASSLTQPGS